MELTLAETQSDQKEAPAQSSKTSKRKDRGPGKVWAWPAAAISGSLLGLCFPPFNQSWAIWVGLMPVTVALWFWNGNNAKRRLKRAFLIGWLMGAFYFGASLHWVLAITEAQVPLGVAIIGWLALSLYCALYPGLWAMLVSFLARPRERWGRYEGEKVWLASAHNLGIALIAALAWPGLEWIRGVLFTGFGWNGLGVAIHDYLSLIQLADLVGSYGLSFFIVFLNVLGVAVVIRLYREFRSRKMSPHFDFIAGTALLALWFIYGLQRYVPDDSPQAESERVIVGVVQPHIPITYYMTMADQKIFDDIYDRLNEGSKEIVEWFDHHNQTQEVDERQDLEVLIWPEAVIPAGYQVRTEEGAGDFIRTWLSDDYDLLFGNVHWEVKPEFAHLPDEELTIDQYHSYNSATMIDGDGNNQIYRKMHLVPFGEYVPFRQQLPFMHDLLGHLVPADFDRGKKAEILETTNNGIKLGALICFEDTVPGLVKKFKQNGAEVLVNLTNDGWFGQSYLLEGHLINSKLRTVENRLPMVRATMNGISAHMDSNGQATVAPYRKMFSTREPGGGYRFDVNIPAPRYSLFSQVGDLFSVSCLTVTIVLLAIGVIKSRKATTASSELSSTPDNPPPPNPGPESLSSHGREPVKTESGRDGTPS